MSERSALMTYETLFEISRLEKTRDDLQKLDPTFFKDVLAYLCEKKRTFEIKESKKLMFERDSKEQARLEYENVKKILKDIYDRREKKILYMALNKSRSGLSLVNIGAMLPSEQSLFHSVNSTLGDFREKTLFKLVCGELPCTRDPPNMEELNSKIKSSQLEDEENERQLSGHFKQPENIVENPSQQSEEAKELKTTHFLSKTAESFKKVRFLSSIEEIIGPDLQIYGPFDSGAISELPKDLAVVLIEKQQAEPA